MVCGLVWRCLCYVCVFEWLFGVLVVAGLRGYLRGGLGFGWVLWFCGCF